MLGFHRFSTSEHADYRFGFNGQEKDDEVKGNGNSLDFGARIHDPRIGRFLSVDPRTPDFPWLSTYAFAANNPIRWIDVNGEGPGDGPFTGRATKETGGVQIWRITTSQRVAMSTYMEAAYTLSPYGALMGVGETAYRLYEEPNWENYGGFVLTTTYEGGMGFAEWITDAASKDPTVGANQSMMKNWNQKIKVFGKLFGAGTVLTTALDNSPTRQETLEAMTFAIADRAYGDVNIVNEGLITFNPQAVSDTETAERGMNRLYNTLSQMLPEAAFDLSSEQGFGEAVEFLNQVGVKKILDDMNRNIGLDKDSDEQCD